MKSRFIILFILLSIIFAACKNKAVDISSFEITVENVLTDSNVAHISGTFSCAKEVATMKINIGLDESLSDVSVYSVQVTGKDFSVALEGLNPGNKYYYCYSVNFGTSKNLLTDVESFTTLVGLPVVKTVKVQPDGDAGCQVACNATSDGGSSIIERGICWNTSGNPSINDHAIADEHNGLGEYVCHVSGLSHNTTYYIRAYAKNSIGVSYGEVMQFELVIEETLPEIQTTSVSGITATSAVCGGIVTAEGSSSVTRRGVCWSTTPIPTTSSNHLDSGSGLGEFSVTLTGLTPNATYYVRAYAKNSQGLEYGNEVKFTTLSYVGNLPTVITTEVTNITQGSATCGGKVTDDGGSEVTNRGVCWSTMENPVVSDNATEVGSGLGDFVSNISGLSAGKTYYVRAYATNNVGTGYGEQLSFTTLPVPEVPIGALDGLFSVNATKRVWFSRGNLQYQASTDTWRFFEDQTDFIGENNSSMSSNYSGWIDLFGWGTSNYNHGAISYRPWSTNVESYYYYAYGNATCHLYQQSGKADWGYNRIQNGGNQEHYGWRTLTNAEWEYLFSGRQTASGIRFAKAVVKGVNGLILLPDDWAASTYQFTKPNISSCPYTTNVINATNWNMLQTHGVVFLPAGGTRTNTNVDVDGSGYYWSACQKNASVTAYYLQFSEDTISQNSESKRSDGRLVRLVYDKQ